MRAHEFINELTFYGSQCTDDCSGHKAGWDWERRKHTHVRRQTRSNSFNNGTGIAVDQAKQGRRPIGPQIRGDKGKFVKFTPKPRNR